MIPILGTKKLRPGVVLNLTEVTQPGKGRPRLLVLELFCLVAFEGAWPTSLSFPERTCPCQRQGKEVSASFGILFLLSKAPKCLPRSQNVREHQQGRRRGPPNPRPAVREGRAPSLTSIKRLTHRRTAESHPSRPPPSVRLPDLLPERGPPPVLARTRQAGGRRGDKTDPAVDLGAAPFP